MNMGRVVGIVIFMLSVAIVVFASAMAIHAAYAHIPDRPDLNQWTMSLRSSAGVPCCDGADATPLIDADWKVNKDGHYVVFLEGEWVEVQDSAVVKGPNKYGQTLVWYTKFTGVFVRCFLPAAGV